MKTALAEEEVFSVKESLRREFALSEAKMNLWLRLSTVSLETSKTTLNGGAW